MQLMVKVDRMKAISYSNALNPPGIGSAGSVTIPKGKNEAAISLTNSSAAIGEWPLIVHAVVGGTNSDQACNFDHRRPFVCVPKHQQLNADADVLVDVEVLRELPEHANLVGRSLLGSFVNRTK